MIKEKDKERIKVFDGTRWKPERCKHKKYKKRTTHGDKSPGSYVCKDCGEIIKKPNKK